MVDSTIGSSTSRNRRVVYLLATVAVIHLNPSCQAFVPASSLAKPPLPSSSSWPKNGPKDGSSNWRVIAFSTGGTSDDDGGMDVTTAPSGDDGSKASKTALSLEEKMKSWEATEEEVKAATLGGLVPQRMDGKGRSDAFDVGLYIAFPIMVISGLLFALFPLIVGNLDVDSVGPPPTI